MIYAVVLPCCHRGEPFRATPVPVRVCAICLRALAVQKWNGKRINSICHALTGLAVITVGFVPVSCQAPQRCKRVRADRARILTARSPILTPLVRFAHGPPPMERVKNMTPFSEGASRSEGVVLVRPPPLSPCLTYPAMGGVALCQPCGRWGRVG